MLPQQMFQLFAKASRSCRALRISPESSQRACLWPQPSAIPSTLNKPSVQKSTKLRTSHRARTDNDNKWQQQVLFYRNYERMSMTPVDEKVSSGNKATRLTKTGSHRYSTTTSIHVHGIQWTLSYLFHVYHTIHCSLARVSLSTWLLDAASLLFVQRLLISGDRARQQRPPPCQRNSDMSVAPNHGGTFKAWLYLRRHRRRSSRSLLAILKRSGQMVIWSQHSIK